MSFGFPGSNTHIENHGVSEESFWPSFTDIMMVIVMVFLFVTVAVILNNWTLISELKNSIKEQGIASSLAENRQVKNNTLQEKLSSLESQLVALNEKYLTEKNVLNKQINQNEVAISVLQTNLSNKSQSLDQLQQAFNQSVEKNTNLTQLNADQKSTLENELRLKAELQATIEGNNNDLALLTKDYQISADKNKQLSQLGSEQRIKIKEAELAKQSLQEALDDKNRAIAILQKDYTLSTEKNTQLVKQQDAQQIKIEEAQSVKQALQATLEAKSNILASLQSDQEKKLSKIESLQKDLSQQVALLESLEGKRKEEQRTQADLLKNTEQALESSESEKQSIIVAMTQKLSDSELKVASLESKLEKIEEAGNYQLRSLQGEYDTLDEKYQKLLQPARSSKGKYVVSISYKKSGNINVIRLKESPDGEYKTVSLSGLNKALSRLKEKHGTDLYLKIIIPNKSGLTYNEAWKFTSTLQRKYDYYHQ